MKQRDSEKVSVASNGLSQGSDSFKTHLWTWTPLNMLLPLRMLPEGRSHHICSGSAHTALEGAAQS